MFIHAAPTCTHMHTKERGSKGVACWGEEGVQREGEGVRDNNGGYGRMSKNT